MPNQGGPFQGGTQWTTPPQALWTWTVPVSSTTPIVSNYSNGQVTKSGIMPSDLQAFMGVPLNLGGPNGTPIPDSQLIQYIRWAEDIIETKNGILLTPAWCAAPPELTLSQVQAASVPGINEGMMLGVHYDIAESGYDFFYERAEGEGWLYVQLRNRPIRQFQYGGLAITNEQFTAVRNYAYVYPLLNQFFQIPPTWVVEDADLGLVRVVPSTNILMLPLFAIEIAVLGFSQSLPGAMHVQYTAGLTASDYNNKWAFMPQYVLAQTAIQVLTTMQLSINYGATDLMFMTDMMRQETKYSPQGAFSGQISAMKEMAKEFYAMTTQLVSGPFIQVI